MTMNIWTVSNFVERLEETFRILFSSFHMVFVAFPTKMNFLVLIVISNGWIFTRLANISFSKVVAFDCDWCNKRLWSTKWATKFHFPVSLGIKFISTWPRMSAMILINTGKSCCTDIKWFEGFIKINRLADDPLISGWARDIHMGWFRKSGSCSGTNWITSSTNRSSVKLINKTTNLGVIVTSWAAIWSPSQSKLIAKAIWWNF